MEAAHPPAYRWQIDQASLEPEQNGNVDAKDNLVLF
jgi:hypothetical protein